MSFHTVWFTSYIPENSSIRVINQYAHDGGFSPFDRRSLVYGYPQNSHWNLQIRIMFTAAIVKNINFHNISPPIRGSLVEKRYANNDLLLCQCFRVLLDLIDIHDCLNLERHVRHVLLEHQADLHLGPFGHEKAIQLTNDPSPRRPSLIMIT